MIERNAKVIYLAPVLKELTILLGEQTQASQRAIQTIIKQMCYIFGEGPPILKEPLILPSNLCWKADRGSILLYVFKYLHPGHLPLQLDRGDVLIYTSAYTRAHTQSSYFLQITLPPTSKTG